MLKRFGITIIIMGIILVSYASFVIFDYYSSSKEQLKMAESYMDQYDKTIGNTTSVEEKVSLLRKDLVNGEIFATLEIPSIGLHLPIVEGTEEEQLKYGVGHEPSTWLPGEENLIFLAGHNGTAFLKLGEVQNGDRIILHLPYGSFEYEMQYSEIGDDSEVHRLESLDHESLLLMTCYPFYSFVDTQERYFIYANPVN
jgi:sortase A